MLDRIQTHFIKQITELLVDQCFIVWLDLRALETLSDLEEHIDQVFDPFLFLLIRLACTPNRILEVDIFE